jgi:tetratricopeptide (TPR) repeat protein
MDAADLNSLCLRAGQKDNYTWLIHDLSNPHPPGDPAFYSGSEESFRQGIEKLNSRLVEMPEVKHLLDLFLLTRYLLDPGEVPRWAVSWLNDHIDFERHFPEVDGLQAFGEKFCATPVVSVIDKACVHYFITGLVAGTNDGSLWPAWVDPLLDDSAKQAIRSASYAARSYKPLEPGTSLYCFPLTIPNKKCQFAGSSLGLAMAIGFLAVLSGRRISGRLLATGSINSNGDVAGVGNLDRKLICARRKGFSVFLRPDQDYPGSPPPDVEVLPVSDLSEAWLMASLHAPGRGHELLTLLSMLRDPRVFVNNLDHVDHRWIRRTANLDKWQKIANAVKDSPELFTDFVEKLNRLLKSWNLDAAATLCKLITPEMFGYLSDKSPLSAFRFCTLNITLYNHRGNVADAEKWASKGHDLLKPALAADINACADFLNNRYVTLHNCYKFEPEFPQELKSLLNCLEKRYAVQCGGGCFSDPVMGELYGTIAQNFAFCGADYLPKCENFIHRAVSAFGDGRVTEYKNQILREYCYLVYAYLDADHIDRAETTLRAYLEVADWSQIWSQVDDKSFGPFQHAVLARFLADSEFSDKKKTYFRWALKHTNILPCSNHPWQLWSYNVGRMAHDMEDFDSAVMLYSQSFADCMSNENGSTVKVMALLPCAGLKQLNALDRVNFKDKEKGIRKAARELDPDHFILLSENDIDFILDTVWEQPQRLFPFTYR